MALTRDQRLERLRLRLAELALWRDRAHLDLDGWRFDGRPLAPGQPWPRREGAVSLYLDEARVPADWPLEETWLELDLGGEALVRLSWEGGRREFGLDPWHRRFPVAARRLAIEVEATARLPFGVPHPDPRLHRSRLIRDEPEVSRLVRRLELAALAVAALGEDEAAEPLLAAAERCLAAIRWPSASGTYLGRAAASPQLAAIWSPPVPAEHPEPLPPAARESVARAVRGFDAELARLRTEHPARGRLAVVGHAHIDLAWLWPLEETRRKVRRTFSTVAGLLDEDPDLTFTQSSAELYEQAREADPELFERIRALAAAGRWEPAGGMWVEPDLNLTAGESIVRQLLRGQLWFERELGARHRVAWLPDCFGFTPALPQLLRSAGIQSFFTVKLTWSETNRFPHDVFWWEGLDGSRVLAHMFDNAEPGRASGLGGYNADTTPAVLLGTWRRFRGRHLHPESLLTFGHGDGGGGPSREMLLELRDLAGFPALPATAYTRVDGFFERLGQALGERADVPVWAGELYLELHRGTLTTQGRTKWLHRRAERDLVAAEVAASLCELATGEAFPADLAGAWRLLLRNQFHDILPGSGIAEVARQAESELAEAAGTAAAAAEGALARLAGSIAAPGESQALALLNPDLSSRPLRVVAPRPLPGAQPVAGGWALTAPEQVLGLETVVVTEAPPPAGPARATGLELENGLLRVRLAPDGTLASVLDRRLEREALAGPGNQLWAYGDRPRAWDAWDVDAGYAEQGEPLGPPESIEVLEPGPHRAALRLTYRWRSSLVVQDVRLWAGSPRLEFSTRLDWHDRRILLKARFPLAVRSPVARFETAFGVVERPTHRNTSWDEARFEVAGHRFCDLSEPGYGVALLNDGRYGHHALGGELGLSLLRSPVYPDPLADEGEHRLTYALLPHPGSWLEGGVLMEAEDLNRPLLTAPCRSQGPARSRPLRVEGLPLGLAALKRAEAGEGLVLRLYEPQGARGNARVELAGERRLTSELDLLEGELGEPDLRFAPFQVRTHLIR